MVNKKWKRMAAYKNPFLSVVETCLSEMPLPVSEYELLKEMQHRCDRFCFNLSDTLDQFKSHFLLFNALYTIQERLLDAGYHLEINPLAIEIMPLYQAFDQQLTTGASAELKAFYLDWANLESATHESVDELLGSFWERFVAIDKMSWAFKQLDLEEASNREEINQQFRRKAMQHHPDRGGEEGHFKSLIEARDILLRAVGP